MKAGITAIRRVRKSDNNRIARACGATVCSRTDEIRDEDIGTEAGLFEIRKFGDEYFTFITECKNPKVREFHWLITITLGRCLVMSALSRLVLYSFAEPAKISSWKLKEIFKMQCKWREMSWLMRDLCLVEEP